MSELAKAYVQIIPTTQGIKEKLKEGLDSPAEESGRSAGSKIGGMIKSAIAAAGIGQALKSAISEGAALEQSLGGIETLFKDSADAVIENAKNAYKTAGLSANSYMEMVTGFSASLLQGLGGDTAAAAKIADMALTDMSDNANKMGTDMEAIQTAYQGFAKQNYTMLDNLKLGYGGTKTEMERLLADAQALTGVKYDINNLSDVYSAIHVIQGELDITGTTAKEASTTISGSMASMKAAFQNVLGNLALGEAMWPSMKALQDTVLTFVRDNLLPALVNIIGAMPSVLIGLVSNLAPGLLAAGIQAVQAMISGITNNFPDLLIYILDGVSEIADAVINGVPELVAAGIELVGGIADGLLWAAPELLAKIPEMIDSLSAKVTESVPVLIETATGMIGSIAHALPESIQAILAVVPQIITSLVSYLVSYLPTMAQAGLELLRSLVTELPAAVLEIVAVVPEIVQSICATLTDNLPAVIQTGLELICALVDDLPGIIDGIIDVLPEIIDAVVAALLQSIPVIVETGVQLLTSLVGALPTIMQTIAGSMPQIIGSITRKLGTLIPQIVSAGVQLLVALVKNLPAIISGVVRAIPSIISALLSAISGFGSSFVEAGKNLLLGLGNGIANAVSGVVKKAKNACSKVLNSVKSFFGIHSPSREMAWIGEMLDAGLANGISEHTKEVSKAIDQVTRLTSESFRSDLGVSVSYGAGQFEVTGRDHQNDAANVLQLLRQCVAMLGEYLPGLTNMQVVMDTGVTVGALAPKMDEALGRRQLLKARV